MYRQGLSKEGGWFAKIVPESRTAVYSTGLRALGSSKAKLLIERSKGLTSSEPPFFFKGKLEGAELQILDIRASFRKKPYFFGLASLSRYSKGSFNIFPKADFPTKYTTKGLTTIFENPFTKKQKVIGVAKSQLSEALRVQIFDEKLVRTTSGFEGFITTRLKEFMYNRNKKISYPKIKLARAKPMRTGGTGGTGGTKFLGTKTKRVPPILSTAIQVAVKETARISKTLPKPKARPLPQPKARPPTISKAPISGGTTIRGTAISQATKQATRSISDVRPRISTASFIATIQPTKLKLTTTTTPIVKQRIGIAESSFIFKTGTEQRLREPSFKITTPFTPAIPIGETPTRPLIIPIPPPFLPPGGGFGFSQGRRTRGIVKFKGRYTPSVEAVLRNIRGKKGKRYGFAEISGLQLRPYISLGG